MRRTRTQAETIKYIERFYSVAGAKRNTLNPVARHVRVLRFLVAFISVLGNFIPRNLRTCQERSKLKI